MWRRVAFWAAVGAAARLAAAECGACQMKAEIKSRHLEVIKNEMLRRMGFQSAPNVTGRALPPVPAHFLARVESEAMQGDQPTPGYAVAEEEDDYHIKTQSVIAFAQPLPRLRHSWRDHDILHFAFSDSTTKFHVANATLHLFVKGSDRRPPPDLHLELFKVCKEAERPEAPGLHRVAARKVAQPAGRGAWLQIELTQTVAEWFRNGRDNHGFVVNVTNANTGKKVALIAADSEMMPYVEIATSESKRRMRRNVGLNCDEKSTETICCRYPLIVDFEKFNWDFIIAPKRYDAYYCMGECPHMTMQRNPHTQLTKYAAPESATPCCVPRKMSAISMLFFDQNLNVVYGNLPGMVVERCGCS